MKISKIGILTAIVIAEGILIISLITMRQRALFIFKSVPASVINPLETAMDYEAPDHIFEKIVKDHPVWMKYRLRLPDKSLSDPILADCAMLNRTNYVRILIANGADVKVALGSLNNMGATNAIELLRQVQSELQSRK